MILPLMRFVLDVGYGSMLIGVDVDVEVVVEVTV